MLGKTRGDFINEVLKSMEGFPFSVHNEKKVQEEIAQCFDEDGIKYEREVRLDKGSIIDFVIPMGEKKVGLEVKIKSGTSAENIFKQCKRYCELNEGIDYLILATSFSMGFPEEINGKPCYYFSLSKGLL